MKKIHDIISENKKVFIVLIGSPASGKSFISLSLMDKFGDKFVRLNNDTDKSRINQKCSSAIADQKSVLLDNTNAKRDNRDKFF